MSKWGLKNKLKAQKWNDKNETTLIKPQGNVWFVNKLIPTE